MKKKIELDMTIDNFILMRLWIKDENFNKTLGEMIPIYKEYINQKEQNT